SLRDVHLQPRHRAGDGARPRDLCLRPLDAEALGAPALDGVRLLGAGQPGAILVPADEPGYPARLGYSRLPRDRARRLGWDGALPGIPSRSACARIVDLVDGLGHDYCPGRDENSSTWSETFR